MVLPDPREWMGSMVTEAHQVLKEKKGSLEIKENLVRVDLRVLKDQKVILEPLGSLDLLENRGPAALKENLVNPESTEEKGIVVFKETPDCPVNLDFKVLREKLAVLALLVNRVILDHLELRETLAPSVHQDFRELREIKAVLDLKDQPA